MRMTSITRVRRNLLLWLVLLFVEIAVVVVSLLYIADPVSRVLCAVGAGLSAVLSIYWVIRLTTEVGRMRTSSAGDRDC